VNVVSASTAHGRTSGKAADAVRAADAEWLKAYTAKDLDKAVAFCDEQGSMLMPNAPSATGKDAIAKLIASHLRYIIPSSHGIRTESASPDPANLAIRAAHTN